MPAAPLLSGDPIDAASLLTAVRLLARADPRLARIVTAHGPPPLWDRPGGFRTLVRIILEQQVSLQSAATLFRRIDRTIEGGVSAASATRLGVPGLRELGLTRQKADYVVSLAGDVSSGRLSFARLRHVDDDAALEMLVRVRGIGPWTASIYLLMVLRRPDIWPPGDLALHVALARLRRRASVPSSAEAERYARRWRPWRSVAARILWHSYLSERSVQA